jgi:hypothetical protein
VRHGRLDHFNHLKAYLAGGGDAAQGSLRHAERGMSVLTELGGKREEALQWAKEALIHEVAESGADPASPNARSELRAVRATAVRLQWLVSAEKGDYRSLLGQEAAPGQIRAALAYGWVEWVRQLGTVEYLPPARVEAARTALGVYRQIEDSTPAASAALAHEIGRFGEALLRQAASASGADRAGELQEAVQVFGEAHGILAGLDSAGALPASGRTDLADFGKDLATVSAKLAGVRAAAR